jgi:hypothetical protein
MRVLDHRSDLAVYHDAAKNTVVLGVAEGGRLGDHGGQSPLNAKVTTIRA